MWPAIMLANSRTASANTFATSPMISTGTSSGAIQMGPGQKCARYAFPPSRTPLATIIIMVTRASVAVVQMLPVAVPPRWVPKRFDTAGIGSSPRMFDGQHEEEDAPDVLDEAIGVLVQRRFGDFLAKVLAYRFEPVCGPRGHHRVNAVPAAPALDQHRHQRDQQQAGQGEHRNLIGKNRDRPLGVSGPKCAGRSISGC